jgi:hypothetical protein
MAQKKLVNMVSLEGLLYEHKLEKKVSGDNSKNPGTEYITGTISIATDGMECLNIVPVHFSYVTATTSTGKPNRNYGLFVKILNGELGTVMSDGKEAAAKLHVDSAIDLNEFYTENENKEDELVSSKRIEGGFISEVAEIDESVLKRNHFKVDMLITKVNTVEADEERQLPAKAVVSGYIFNFRRELLPVSFSATNPAAMNYFEGLGASEKEPTFTQLWGSQLSQTVVKKTETKNAFGETLIDEAKYSRKDYIITGAASETYEWDDENTLTAKEVTEMLAAREVKLATLKKNREDYKAAKATSAGAAKTTKGDYDF